MLNNILMELFFFYWVIFNKIKNYSLLLIVFIMVGFGMIELELKFYFLKGRLVKC